MDGWLGSDQEEMLLELKYEVMAGFSEWLRTLANANERSKINMKQVKENNLLTDHFNDRFS